MSVTQSQPISAPFDAIADRYDGSFTDSKVGRAQRTAVWMELEKAFHAPDRVLEIGCGTGVDACFLAKRGVRVLACDISERMIGVAAQRVRQTGNEHFVEARQLAAENIARLAGTVFDGAFSNFGVLNCVRDLDAFAAKLSMLLRPGAPLLLCWMGPGCLWEVFWYLGHAKPGKAFRRLHAHAVTARLAEGSTVDVTYPSVRALAKKFSPFFELRSVKGIGVAVPPSYMEPWANRFSRLFDLAVRAESHLASSPGIRLLGDHVLAQFERRAD